MNLFQVDKTNRELSKENAEIINGLGIYCDFITNLEEKELIINIDKNNWLNDLKRRVQHYGYKYDYKARKIDASCFIGNIPLWMSFLIERMNEKNIIDYIPDQAIINEYIDNQGISSHIDCEPCFGDTIISISLNGSCIMNFERNPFSEIKIPIFLEQKSLLVMRGESRYSWYHAIPARKSDTFNGAKHKRTRRLSITFRKVVLSA